MEYPRKARMRVPGAREVHIHLTVEAGTSIRIAIGNDDVSVKADGVPTTSGGSDHDVVEEAIRRLERAGVSPHVREAADRLRDLGYRLVPADTRIPGKRPENYLRIMDPEYTAHGVGYLTPGNFSFSRAFDRERLSHLPGAKLLTSEVAFTHVTGVEPGLAAARLLKD
jgi:hypothetical protein